MHGFYNRILTINVGTRESYIEQIPDALLEKCLGGKGLATHLLLERNPIKVEPLSAENNFIIATGPFCGGRLWGGSRYGIFTKSPLTNLYTESYSGGRVPEAIDAAGFDAIVIGGKAEAPLVLAVHPEGVIFHQANDIWGMETFEAEEEIVKRFAPGTKKRGRAGALTIGPAGEKQVRFAIIANDKWRCAGRTGVGAVLGSKLVKGVVFYGDRKREYGAPDAVARYALEFSKSHAKHPATKAYKALGTTMMVSLMNTAGAFPAKYWQAGSCDHWEQISGETLHGEHDVKPQACAKCFLACGRRTKIQKGRRKGLELEGPEYETIYSFGGLCMITEIEEVSFLNDLCDRLGMDTISAGNLCSFAMAASEAGKIPNEISFGNVDQVAELLGKIAAREDIGNLLADGILATARAWEMEEFAVHVKGLEPPGYDPRKLKGMGLSYGTAPRGACHLRTTFYKPELSGLIPPEETEGKAALLVDYENRLNIFDTLVLCRFYRDFYTWEELETVMKLVTGKLFTNQMFQDIASHIADMTRKFNLQEGATPEQDHLPTELYKQPLPDGSRITRQEMQLMLNDYYRLRGWDKGRNGLA